MSNMQNRNTIKQTPMRDDGNLTKAGTDPQNSDRLLHGNKAQTKDIQGEKREHSSSSSDNSPSRKANRDKKNLDQLKKEEESGSRTNNNTHNV